MAEDRPQIDIKRNQYVRRMDGELAEQIARTTENQTGLIQTFNSVRERLGLHAIPSPQDARTYLEEIVKPRQQLMDQMKVSTATLEAIKDRPDLTQTDIEQFNQIFERMGAGYRIHGMEQKYKTGEVPAAPKSEIPPAPPSPKAGTV